MAQTYTIAEGTTTIDNNVFNDIVAAAANNEVEVILPAETTINVALTNESSAPKSMVLPEGLSIKFTGADAAKKSTLSWTKSLGIDGTHGYIRFENLILTDAGSQYLINQANVATVEEIAFTSCELKDFERSIIRTQGSNAISINSIVIDKCVGTNLSSGDGYSVFVIGDASHAIGKIEIKNSTFDTTKRSFIENSKADIANGIIISNSTLYNNQTSGRYLVDANGKNTNITFDKVILGKTYSDAAKGIRTAGTITITDRIRTTDCIYAANDIKELTAGDKTSAEIFTAPDSHDFTLLIDDKVGDPRWYKSGTGIADINADANAADAPAYNLAGQRVNVNAKGLVIKNGKKYVNK